MKLGLFLLTLSFISHAQDFSGEIRNFNINYMHPSGQASSEYLDIDQVRYDQHTKYEVEIQAGSLFLTTPEEMIQIDNLPSSVVDVNELHLRSLNMLSNSSLVQLNFSKLIGIDPSQRQDIDRFGLSCNKQLAGSTFQETLLNSCLNIKGSLRLGKYRKDGKDQMSSLKFDTQGSKMKFEVKVASLKVKGTGRTYYQNNMIRIKIDKAKVGPLNVKKKLFDELKKMRSTTVRVNSPWIEIDV